MKNIWRQWPAMPGSKSRDLMMYESFGRGRGGAETNGTEASSRHLDLPLASQWMS